MSQGIVLRFRTEDLARDVGADVEVAGWALYRCARHYGLGQDVFVAGGTSHDPGEIRDRYSDVGGSVSAGSSNASTWRDPGGSVRCL